MADLPENIVIKAFTIIKNQEKIEISWFYS